MGSWSNCSDLIKPRINSKPPLAFVNLWMQFGPGGMYLFNGLQYYQIPRINGNNAQLLCSVRIEIAVGSLPYSRFIQEFQLPGRRGYNLECWLSPLDVDCPTFLPVEGVYLIKPNDISKTPEVLAVAAHQIKKATEVWWKDRHTYRWKLRETDVKFEIVD